jgi:uncharacterized protein
MVIRFLIFSLLIYVLYRVIKEFPQLKRPQPGNYRAASSSQEGEELVEDPVCHTYIPVSQAYIKEISGRNYYFCSEQCGNKYVSEGK